MPKTETELPWRPKLLRDTVLPKHTTSNTASDDPRLETPMRDIAEPSRKIPRRAIAEPSDK
jgi:hypothetical protein